MEVFFYLFGLIAILSTLCVITNTKPVNALLYLIVSLISISCIFFLLGSDFIGSLEIIIYAGAIMVLFVFVIMMLNININYNKKKHSLKFYLKLYIFPSIIFVLLLVILIYSILNIYFSEIYGKIITVKIIGITLFNNYVLAVEFSSMLLLSAIIIVFHLSYHAYDKNKMFYDYKNNKIYDEKSRKKV